MAVRLEVATRLSGQPRCPCRPYGPGRRRASPRSFARAPRRAATRQRRVIRRLLGGGRGGIPLGIRVRRRRDRRGAPARAARRHRAPRCAPGGARVVVLTRHFIRSLNLESVRVVSNEETEIRGNNTVVRADARVWLARRASSSPVLLASLSRSPRCRARPPSTWRRAPWRRTSPGTTTRRCICTAPRRTSWTPRRARPPPRLRRCAARRASTARA